jgi:catechol 2,3-dioxygenase-like lactoylglutathione lyase family enzyme
VKIAAIDHVQIAIPVGEEDRARGFYGGLLGLTEVPKPPEFAGRGGAWFELGDVHVHLGVEADFRPARKAHIAFIVDDVQALNASARAAGYEVKDDDPLEGVDRIFVFDPFGNRLEFQQPLH